MFLIAKANMEQPICCLLWCHHFTFVLLLHLPPYSADLLLYKGYQSFPVTVFDTNTRGYCLDHFSSIMHGDFGFIVQGPCVIFFIRTSFKPLSTLTSGIQHILHSSFHLNWFCYRARLVCVHVAIFSFALPMSTSSSAQTRTLMFYHGIHQQFQLLSENTCFEIMPSMCYFYIRQIALFFKKHVFDT